MFAVGGRRRRARGDADEPDALVRLTHRTIKGVTEDLERFRFNTAISKLQVLTNEMRAALDAGRRRARAAARALAQMLAPFAPFAAEELWREVLGNGSSRARVVVAVRSTRRWPPRRR